MSYGLYGNPAKRAYAIGRGEHHLFFSAKEKSVVLNNSTMSFVELGRGKKPLVILPGLSDGLKTVKGQAINLAFYFRAFSKDFKVYVFSRKEQMDNTYTTQKMAKDLKEALDHLGIGRTYLMGVSQGGMIAQHFAIDYPDTVEKIVIAVSASRANDTLRSTLSTWIAFARKNDYKSLMIDTLEKSYSQQKLKTYKLAYPLISRIGKPKSFDRFLVQANAILRHDTYHQLERIVCPALIIGGDCDKVTGREASAEMAEKIPDSRLIMYEGLGHATYEEGKDFNKQVKDFLLNR